MTERKPYHLNVVGDFYVEDGCCLDCGLPEHYAPTLFASVMDHEQCFVKKQPETAEELGRMMEVLSVQDIGCVRYRGSETAIVSRIESIDPSYIDGHSAAGLRF